MFAVQAECIYVNRTLWQYISRSVQLARCIYFKQFFFLNFLPLSSASICSSALTFIFIPAIPPILNIIAPRNESRGREFVYPAYYFVDEQRYYYPILAHMISIALILATVYIACDTNLIYVIQHGCALLTISGWVNSSLSFYAWF